jgi:CTP synthase (UTP-ammonia lyase)
VARLVVLGDRDPDHLTHRELDAALALMPAGVEAAWTATESPEARRLDDAAAIWLAPGTPYRDDEAAYAAIRHAIRRDVPFLGTCGGFQYACVELARSVAEVSHAVHAESDPDAEDPVVERLACSLYGERRTVHPVAGTRLAAICGGDPFEGFHWCGYGLAHGHLAGLRSAGVVVSATADDAGVEAIELPAHPFFVATLFQPQVGSSESGRLHPLVGALVEVATRR